MQRSAYIHHSVLFVGVLLTLVPFYFVISNAVRSNNEIFRSPFGFPQALTNMLSFTKLSLTGRTSEIAYVVRISEGDEITFETRRDGYKAAMSAQWKIMTNGYIYAWEVLRGYMINSLFVSLVSGFGVLLLGSITAYVFARYRFPGSNILFYIIISVMMIPGILTLVPSVQLVTALNLRNSYTVLILPYIATGQVFAIFVFRSFFRGLSEDLFDAARMDGAGHLHLYRHVILPLSLPSLSVIAIMNILATWNGFMWPFIVNSDQQYHVIASGLYNMSTGPIADNYSAMFSAYVLSSIPLLLLFVYATRPFIQGMGTGAFKA